MSIYTVISQKLSITGTTRVGFLFYGFIYSLEQQIKEQEMERGLPSAASLFK